MILNRKEHEGRRPGVRQHPETTSERTFGDGQDHGDSDDVVRSGRSKGKYLCSAYNVVCIDHY